MSRPKKPNSKTVDQFSPERSAGRELNSSTDSSGSKPQRMRAAGRSRSSLSRDGQSAAISHHEKPPETFANGMHDAQSLAQQIGMALYELSEAPGPDSQAGATHDFRSTLGLLGSLSVHLSEMSE